ADVPACLLDTVQADAERLFGCRLVLAGTGEEADLKPDRKLSEDGRALLDAIRPYWQHAVRNARYFAMLGGEYRQLEKEKYVYEQHIIDNKRQNVVKKACVSIVTGIVPYIDRIINEVHKLLTLGYLERSDVKCGKYRYIDELATRINEYNEILALWIKMRQGTL
ncbi:MAG TPA: ATP-binding protein, partial [Bacteroides sp.]|nr:ATP-binding protein [Bacteroides sp.]